MRLRLLAWRFDVILTGDEELLRLVELLSIGARTARQIADLRVVDRDEIYALSTRAEAIAEELRQICERGATPQRLNRAN